MVSKYGNLMLPGGFPDKVTFDIDFTDEAVVQCDVPVIQILLSVLLTYKWPQIHFDLNTYVPFLEPVLFKVLASWEFEAYNLRSRLHEKEQVC